MVDGIQALSPGTLFAADFRVVRPLQQGGMGSVYVVEQLSTGRERALKLMHPVLVRDAKLRRRFQQEARVGAHIESAHVVEVVGAGVDEPTGMPWLCMELLRGEDLAATAAAGPMAPGRVAAVFEQLCHALAAAHAAGIVHRDLKPENVFLAASRQSGRPFVVKVLDFGIAKVVAEGWTGDTSPIGTPLWMAPEQTQPGGAISPASDVWALGLIAFRLLTGKVFWRSAHTEAVSVVTIIREVAVDSIPTATERATELGGAELLPAGFDAWFGRCVARAPEERFPDARACFLALAELLGHEPAELPAVPRASRPSGDPQAGLSSLAGLARTPPEVPRGATEAQVAATAAAGPPAPAALRWSSNEDASASEDLDEPTAARPPSRALAIGAAVAVCVGGIGWALWAARGALERHDKDIVAGVESRAKDREAERELQENQRRLRERRTQLDALIGPMIRIEGGAVRIGADDGATFEEPEHEVTLAAFEIDPTEVTLEVYRRCVDAKRCTPPKTGDHCTWGKPAPRAVVNCIDHEQAQAVCAFYAKRLPTEEEWELAARGPRSSRYPWGNTAPSAEPCWRRTRGDARGPCVAGANPAGDSVFGVKDLAGNLREWTSSAFCPYARPSCGVAARVVRGGAWSDEEADDVRATVRGKHPPGYWDDRVGVRCARDALPT